MNKGDMINAIAEGAEISKKDAENALNVFIEKTGETLEAGKKVSLIGFGTFEPRNRSARKGRNPQTGAEMDIPASVTAGFKPGKALKDRLNK